MTPFEAALAFARWLLLAAELQLFGAVVVFTCVGRYPLWQMLRPAFLLLAIAGPVWLVLQAVEMGEPRSAGEVAGVLWLVLSGTLVGHAALLRALCWGVCLVVARRSPAWAVAPAGVALALHGTVGHAAASGETLLQGSILLHLVAAGAWIGGLLPLRLALRGGEAERVARRFSWLGLVCVASIGATAIVQAGVLGGGLPGFVGTVYGHLLLTKLALFAVLLAFAARNLWVLTPRLAVAPSALDRPLLWEAGMGVVLLAAAALLASLPPGAHEQPNWPFPWRPSLEALADDDLRAEISQALLLLLVASCLAFAATLHRWLRIAAPVTACVLIWLALPSLKLLLVPAEPTYYWQSASAGDADAIARGKAAFRIHCVSCHGSTGKGDGPLAARLPIPPADLTAPHLWDHSDGELFWWISHGMEAPDGQVVMPGLAAVLSEQKRWELIDYIRDNNIAGPTLPRAVHHH